MKKQFIVRKYILAESAREAIKKDKITPVDDVYVDERWMEENIKTGIGFNEKKSGH